ncbi:MAG: PaaI family thioesterase [Phascolarctobacterium sp.]|nr:PaaI family thioesterase [Phascolarctobacterium sp.]MBQ3114223.1 PaaI family thioesterase [Phascolarctobacterium sp.]MBQ3540869.1 PaaI family thioesterase [Phascolarctobacterium sp.]MBQ7021174.1 PaaI family thioesterase [Phascolarctobacterium sp.]MBR1976570.1 PaaI family thioesterase [Phascolarctobacterium sp.]
MVEQVKDVPAYIREMYKNNCFMNQFGVEIGEITCGSAVVSIKLDPSKHFNHRGICHGGVLTALADSVLGVTGASVGAAVATLNFSMNFIKNVHSEERIYVKSTIRHHGRTTMVIEAEMYDEEHHTLMATILTTMFIVGRFKEIPEKW